VLSQAAENSPPRERDQLSGLATYQPIGLNSGSLRNDTLFRARIQLA
jgi:hypothetical protein